MAEYTNPHKFSFKGRKPEKEVTWQSIKEKLKQEEPFRANPHLAVNYFFLRELLLKMCAQDNADNLMLNGSSVFPAYFDKVFRIPSDIDFHVKNVRLARECLLDSISSLNASTPIHYTLTTKHLPEMVPICQVW